MIYDHEINRLQKRDCITTILCRISVFPLSSAIYRTHTKTKQKQQKRQICSSIWGKDLSLPSCMEPVRLIPRPFVQKVWYLLSVTDMLVFLRKGSHFLSSLHHHTSVPFNCSRFQQLALSDTEVPWMHISPVSSIGSSLRTKYVREVQFIKVPLRQIIPALLW